MISLTVPLVNIQHLGFSPIFTVSNIPILHMLVFKHTYGNGVGWLLEEE
jgi:hypothetical protein